MEKVSDFGSEDSRFESWQGRFVHLKRDLSLSNIVSLSTWLLQAGIAPANVQEIDILYGDYLGEMEDISIQT